MTHDSDRPVFPPLKTVRQYQLQQFHFHTSSEKARREYIRESYGFFFSPIELGL
jgi:hypothetical protein